MACWSVLSALAIIATSAIAFPNSPLGTPQLTLPNLSPVCAPYVLPEIDIPTDFPNCAAEIQAAKGQENPDTNKPTPEVVRLHGFFYEGYNVTTSDGYILTVDRITGGPSSPPAPGKRAVFLNHGLLGAGDNWLIQSDLKNLAFILAEAGFDVWLGNCRGTTYSQRHETLNPDTDIAYWDFSWEEMGLKDVPAVIDTIIEKSGNSKIFYVGYSMGTTQYFVSLSSIPELNDKIEVGILLAPIAYMGHSNNVVRLIAPTSWTGAQYAINPLVFGRIDQFQRFREATNMSAGDTCTPILARCGLCDNVYFLVGGYNPSQVNYADMPNLFSKTPNTASFKTLVHYSQSMNSCKFRHFDYGRRGNMKKYGCFEPPLFNITKITTPTYMFHGPRDNFGLPADVEITRSHMQPSTVKNVTLVADPRFNHLDMLYGKTADVLVYNYVRTILLGVQDAGGKEFVWIDETVASSQPTNN